MEQKCLYLVTTNSAKHRYLKKAMRPLGIDVIWKEEDLPMLWSRKPEKLYSKEFLTQVAGDTVLSAYERVGHACAVIAVGLYIPVLDNSPGVLLDILMKSEKTGNKDLLKRMAGEKDRRAILKQSLAYVPDHLTQPAVFDSLLDCIITKKECGKLKDRHWLPVWQILKPEGYKTTLAAMNDREWQKFRRNRVESGQSIISKFGDYISERMEQLPDEVELFRKKEADELPEP